MQVVSWNIQATLGCDGVFSVQRIVDTLKQWPQADVICLQEVARFFPEHGHNDQMALFCQAFPEYSPVWGAALSWPLAEAPPPSEQKTTTSDQTAATALPARREFGNLTLVRSEKLADYRVHVLPSPALDGIWQMPRCAVETLVCYQNEDGSDGVVRIINTHLAFHHQGERRQQIDALSQIRYQAELKRESEPARDTHGCYLPAPETAEVLLCGDLNLAVEGEDYDWLTNDLGWHDCWAMLNEETPHLPTCGCHDHKQWPEGEHCRDFFLCNTEFLMNRALSIKNLVVDTQTDASDHQPLCLTLSA